MLFSKLFKRNDALDKNLERHLLFAPNYLITTEELQRAKRYIYGGHSILVIEENEDGNGLYFERSRTSKSNKFTGDQHNQLHIGFQSINGLHYLILGLRQDLTNLDIDDYINFRFRNDQMLKLQLEAPVDNFGDGKKYACNLRAQLTKENIEQFKTQLVSSYVAEKKDGHIIAQSDLDKEFNRRLRELAQTYAFSLQHHYHI